ncbi:hypothetical protein ABZ897_22940 [Nonomuraea sp. NPDC046802]|uniref:hypothetical protein n=1 Tax=Nonomuraea sp. NPDC046802 TaxID=3154919 RepID=UPI0033D40819
MLRLCLTGTTRKGVLDYAGGGQRFGRRAARWRALPGALAGLWRPEDDPVADEWALGREAGGWALRRFQEPGGAPVYFTIDIPADDQNAAFDWAEEVTPPADRRAIHYVGPPPG